MKQKLIAELLGTAFLLAVVVGSGIMAESLAQGNSAVALLANSLATGAGLFVLISTLSSLSGSHLNPIISLAEALLGRLDLKTLFGYWLAQFSGAVFGILLTHLMFDQDIFQISLKDRSGPHLWVSEVVAAFVLISVIILSRRKRAELVPVCVAVCVAAGCWFTPSSFFVNPALTVGRMFTNTFCGVAPVDVIPFVIAQVLGAVLAFLLLRKLDKVI